MVLWSNFPIDSTQFAQVCYDAMLAKSRMGTFPTSGQTTQHVTMRETHKAIKVW